MVLLRSITLDGILSFRPESAPLSLEPLNVLIGPNGSGKSNLIEAIELLHATPTALASAIRDGGGAREWLWKGEGGAKNAKIEAALCGLVPTIPDLRYKLSFTSAGQRTELTDEAIEELERRNPNEATPYFYYRFQSGHPVLNVREVADGLAAGPGILRNLKRQSLIPDESVLSQRKDPDLYPELTWVGKQFTNIQTFREWSFGRYVPLRQPQPATLQSKPLLADSTNLGLILNQLEHTDAGPEFNRLIGRFLPRFRRFSTLIEGGTVQFYLHEQGLKSPVPATRLSDGTIRFMALLALLLAPIPPSLICIEEPELGLHPDALGLLAELMVQASTRTQLIVTTHSDALVSAFTEFADSVIVCENNGGTEFRRVERDRLRYWLNQYRLGEIWRIGELGGNP